jgi:putative redox protein
MKQTGLYLGKNRVEMTHSGSDVTIITDAPKDHDGLGESFAPTDLLAASVGSCILTIMGIEATKRNWILEGANAIVEKFIAPEPPRRVSKVIVSVWLPDHLTNEQKDELKLIAAQCPVTLSIQDSVEIVIDWLNA